MPRRGTRGSKKKRPAIDDNESSSASSSKYYAPTAKRRRPENGQEESNCGVDGGGPRPSGRAARRRSVLPAPAPATTPPGEGAKRRLFQEPPPQHGDRKAANCPNGDGLEPDLLGTENRQCWRLSTATGDGQPHDRTRSRPGNDVGGPRNNELPLSPRKTRSHNIRSSVSEDASISPVLPSKHGLLPLGEQRTWTRDRDGHSAAVSSTSAASETSSATSSTAPSVAPNLKPGASKLVSELLFIKRKLLKIVPKLRRMKRKHDAVKLFLREFDFQEGIDFTNPDAASLIKQDIMYECNLEFARIFGNLANRGQPLSDKSSLMALAFAINSSIGYVGLDIFDKVDMGNCCLDWARAYMMYGVFLEGETKLTTELAREFVDKHCTFVDSIQLCCKGTDACPKGNKWPVMLDQLNEEATEFGLSGPDRLAFWNLWGLVNISRHAGYHYARTGKPLNLLYASRRSYDHHHCNPDGGILSNAVVTATVVPHVQAQMHTMPNCKVHTLEKLADYELNLWTFAQAFDGEELSDGTVVKVPPRGRFAYFRRLAKAPGYGSTLAEWEARRELMKNSGAQRLLKAIEDGTQTEEDEQEYLRRFESWSTAMSRRWADIRAAEAAERAGTIDSPTLQFLQTFRDGWLKGGKNRQANIRAAEAACADGTADTPTKQYWQKAVDGRFWTTERYEDVEAEVNAGNADTPTKRLYQRERDRRSDLSKVAPERFWSNKAVVTKGVKKGIIRRTVAFFLNDPNAPDVSALSESKLGTIMCKYGCPDEMKHDKTLQKGIRKEVRYYRE